jgi:predicted house-cleaning noncanonical NTP pyrophosphatase (MazG superfamily)
MSVKQFKKLFEDNKRKISGNTKINVLYPYYMGTEKFIKKSDSVNELRAHEILNKISAARIAGQRVSLQDAIYDVFDFLTSEYNDTPMVVRKIVYKTLFKIFSGKSATKKKKISDKINDFIQNVNKKQLVQSNDLNEQDVNNLFNKIQTNVNETKQSGVISDINDIMKEVHKNINILYSNKDIINLNKIKNSLFNIVYDK